LVLHLNVLQEAIQPEGDTDFRGLLDRIAEVAAGLHVPVIVKEIGCGISGPVARRLQGAGVRLVDVAGLGGTSWARIESRRAPDAQLGERFAGWGIPTPDAIRQVSAIPGITVIGSGGVRTGIDVAKAIALGASLAGLAHPFLAPARESAAAVEVSVRRIVRELRVAMLCSGAGDVDALGRIAIRREVRAS
ncbi:MAG: alpha-hydroxy-acid oxidizing protein, partial [Gemmatimonadota bacterium]